MNRPTVSSSTMDGSSRRCGSWWRCGPSTSTWCRRQRPAGAAVRCGRFRRVGGAGPQPRVRRGVHACRAVVAGSRVRGAQYRHRAVPGDVRPVRRGAVSARRASDRRPRPAHETAASSPAPRGCRGGAARPWCLWSPARVTVECDWVTGAVMFVRREVIAAIGMDGSFFLGAEDADLCVARPAGRLAGGVLRRRAGGTPWIEGQSPAAVELLLGAQPRVFARANFGTLPACSTGWPALRCCRGSWPPTCSSDATSRRPGSGRWRWPTRGGASPRRRRGRAPTNRSRAG